MVDLPQTSVGKSSNLQPNRVSFFRLGSKDSSGAKWRMPRQLFRSSVRSEVRLASGDRSLSCLQSERLRSWSEVRLASGDRLSCWHPPRRSDWSEVRPASGDRSPLSCLHPARESDWSEVRRLSGDRSPPALLS